MLQESIRVVTETNINEAKTKNISMSS